MRKRMMQLLVGLGTIAVTAPVFAQEHAANAVAGGGLSDLAKYFGAAICLGLAAFAGALSQGKAVASACTSMGRNPGAAGPVRITMLLGLAFIESLVIYALVISFMLIGK